MDIREIEKRAKEFQILNLRVCRQGELILKRDCDDEMRRNQ